MNTTQITQDYLSGLKLSANNKDLNFLQQLQSRHIAKYSFNNLAVLLKQPLSLELPDLFEKIVTKGRGGYCFEHNKLLFNVLNNLGFEVRLLLAKVVYNRDIDVPRTHRITLLTFNGCDYIVDVGFGHFGAWYPVKLVLNQAQDQGNNQYRITQDSHGVYHYQFIKDDEFFTLYTFDLQTYTEADCLLGHFFSSHYPDAAFVNNLVISRRYLNETHSLRNHEFHLTKNNDTTTTTIRDTETLHHKLNHTFELDIEIAASQFLFEKFVAGKTP